MMIPLAEGVLKNSIFCQKKEAVKVEMSHDTVGLNGYMEITFEIENKKIQKFTPPDFSEFEIQGPFSSSMMSIVNGETTQRVSYTYRLTPKKTGKLTIGAATIETNEGLIKTDKQNVVAVEYYEMKPQRKPNKGFFFSDDDDDDFFFRSHPTRPKPQPEPDNKKKKYSTEKI